MRLKDGFQTCPNCKGDGCYWCGKSGHRVQCPTCNNSEIDSFTENNHLYTCIMCKTTFDKSGTCDEVAFSY